MQQDWAGHTAHNHTRISDEAGERGPKVKMHSRSVGLIRGRCTINETVHSARARRSIASPHCCCILQSVMPTFTEPKQQGADDMCCCIARLERVAVISAANKFSLPRRPVPVGHWPRGQLHWSAGRFFFHGIPLWFFAQRPQCYLNTCAVPGLRSDHSCLRRLSK